MATELRFYTATQEAWDAMYVDCQRAHESIRFEQYLLKDDETGSRFLELFYQKARQGVRISLSLDSVGSRGLRRSPLIQKIRDAGGEVDFYNPLGWKNIFQPSRWLPRNHCKTMLIDGRIAYIGGMCVAHYMKDWRDLQARITGELARLMAENSARDTALTGNHLYQYILKTSGRHPIYNELLREIARARKSIYLATAYFFPPRRLRQALAEAVRRGVDVKLMLPEKTDVPLAMDFSRSYFPELAEKGIDIRIYAQSVLHAKYVVIDDHWATLGSTNLDYLSLFHNRESNLMIYEPETIATLKQLFENDLQRCRRANPRFTLLQKLFFPLTRRLRRLF